MKITIAIILCLAISQAYTYSIHDIHPIYINRDLGTSEQCGNQGYIYNERCYCLEGYTGDDCTLQWFQGYEDTADQCDDLTNRLDHLFNESPDFAKDDDNEFPRLSGDSIGKGEAAYGEKGNTWTTMHKISSSFSIFKNNKVHPSDVGQGALGNCYLLSALASLANIRDGKPIVDLFETKEDNEEHVYVGRWVLDGKVRMVATDDWVPGSGSRSSFSRPTNDGQFWSMIIEKQWAKIHGEFMITEGGWQTNVWKAMTAAPIGNVKHSTMTADDLFDKVKDMIDNEYAIGSATLWNTKKDLVQGHAYSTLGAYIITSEGKQVKLVKSFNPWASEHQYKNKEWAEGSSKWTEAVKNQIPGYSKKNDGQFYMTHTEYHAQFGLTNWAEIREGYEQSYQQIALADKDQYTASIQNTGTKPFYVSIETVDGRLIKGCNSPFSFKSLTVTSPSGKSFSAKREAQESVYTAFIDQAETGVYKVSANVNQVKKYHKFFTLNTYAYKDTIKFQENADKYKPVYTQRCPKDCSGKGICNTFSGVCRCDHSSLGSDCSQATQTKCPNDCNGQGSCVNNKCQCNKGFSDSSCSTKFVCRDQSGSCPSWAKAGYCVGKYAAQLKKQCQKSCKHCTDADEGEEKEEKKCPNNCSGQGQCQDGKCKCNTGFLGTSCEKKEEKKCPYNCSGNGQCQDGKCKCNAGFSGTACEKKEEKEEKCVDVSEYCDIFKKYGMCTDKSLASMINEKCAKTCDRCGGSDDSQKCKPDIKKYARRCNAWKNAGYCGKEHRNYKYLKNYCPTTCRIDGCSA